MNPDWINQYLYSEPLSPPMLMLVVAIAFILGTIHALGPGHGKSMMAAYLVGTRGRIRDAITVAITLTIAHVFSVILIGLLAMWLMDFFLPQKVGKWISLGSGIMVILVGIWLLQKRIKFLQSKSPETARRRKDESPSEAHDHEAWKPYRNTHHGLPHFLREDDHLHPGYQSHLTFLENVLIGISGGMVPCPKAIVILLLAISLQKIPLGLIIIFAFSLGLAVVLLLLGIITVKASHLLSGRMQDRRLHFLSILGSVVIIGLGIFLTLRTVNWI